MGEAETGEGDSRGSLGVKGRNRFAKKFVLVLQKTIGMILKIAVNEIEGGSLANARNRLFRVIGNSLEFPITRKRH